MRGFRLVIAFLLACLAPWASAWAQVGLKVPPVSRSFDVQLFHPAVGPRGYITLDSADVPGHRQFNVGLLTNYQYGALALDSTMAGVTRKADVVRHQTMAELYGAVGLFNLFEVGLAVPMTLYLSGDDFDDTGETNGGTLTAKGLGDVRVEAKVAPFAFGQDQAFVLGVSVGMTLPTAVDDAFMGHDSVTGRGRILLEYQPSDRFRTVVMLGGALRKRAHLFDAGLGNQILYGAAADVRVLKDMSVLAEVTGRVGSFEYADANPIEADLAMRAYLPAMFSLLMGVGMGMNHGIGAPMVRGFLGVGWAPDFRDQDRDGIIDAQDRCPDEAEDRDGFHDEDGCLDEDNDNDAILDGLDKCPSNYEDFDGFQDDDGCPDLDNDKDNIPDINDSCPNEPEDGQGKRPYDGCPSTQEDTDGDGVVDVKDQCPDEPEDKDGFKDSDGCPDPDNDEDGIPDMYDSCTNDPEDSDGFEDNDGCPDIDNDKDGILDKQDKCPNEPETLNGNKDDDGCPDPGDAIVVLREDKIDVLERMTFVAGQTDLSAGSQSMVKLVAMVLRGHPELARVRIDVRAEGVSEATMKGRAQAVIKALGALRVDSKRLKPGRVISGGSRVQFIIESRAAPKGSAPSMTVGLSVEQAAPAAAPAAPPAVLPEAVPAAPPAVLPVAVPAAPPAAPPPESPAQAK